MSEYRNLTFYPAAVGTITEDAIHSAFFGRELGADILEIRFDLILDGLLSELNEKAVRKECVSLIREIRKTGLPVIGTFRSKKEGGNMDLNSRDAFKWMRFVLPYVDFIDIEWSSPKGKMRKLIDSAHQNQKQVIISSHYFDQMPSKKQMMKMIVSSQKAGADISKIAVMPKDDADVLKLFEAGLLSQKKVLQNDGTQKTGDEPKSDVRLEAKLKTNAGLGCVCLIAMGGSYQYSRIIAPVFGSVLSYGYVTMPAAPGQLRVDEIKSGLKSLNLR
ncbi:type I 3-dehydroquinate dehydratase [Methanolapillus millepedarum]|uniref:3-dehydroquinate dehydratase n=1 Tax=Methanolapillus millepedarum TaxID=3028296 RepID=A0AA96ZVT6_9EURY|nr:3-dehydroquinate dehydratase [Methanosarcinaceae archaeon Ac7]